jgi:NAD+ diphosphatase
VADVAGGKIPSIPAANRQDETAPPFRVPSVAAIAGVLIRDWADGMVGMPESSHIQRENL